MTTRQEILLRLACAALQGGMSISKVYQSIDDIADVILDIEFDADTPPEKDTKSTTNKKKFY